MKQNYFKTKINLSSLPKTSNSFRLLLLTVVFSLFGYTIVAQTNPSTFNINDSNKAFSVPAGVTKIKVKSLGWWWSWGWFY